MKVTICKSQVKRLDESFCSMRNHPQRHLAECKQLKFSTLRPPMLVYLPQLEFWHD